MDMKDILCLLVLPPPTLRKRKADSVDISECNVKRSKLSGLLEKRKADDVDISERDTERIKTFCQTSSPTATPLALRKGPNGTLPLDQIGATNGAEGACCQIHERQSLL
jgi:hypothetical protein